MRHQKGYPNLVVQPEKFTPELARDAAEILRATGSMRRTAKAVRVSRQTLWKWQFKSPEFKEAFYAWQRHQWTKQLRRGLDAKANLAERRRNEGEKSSEIQAGYPDPSIPEKPFLESQTGPEKHFDPLAVDHQEMWRQWEAEQQRKAEEVANAAAEERPGFWTGG